MANLIHALYRRTPAARPGPGARLVAAWRRAVMRARLRRDLERLDDRLLRDAGLTRQDLEAEARRPLWRR